MLGVIGVLIAIALLVFMAYRGWGIIPASLLCSIIVVLTNKGDYGNPYQAIILMDLSILLVITS